MFYCNFIYVRRFFWSAGLFYCRFFCSVLPSIFFTTCFSPVDSQCVCMTECFVYTLRITEFLRFILISCTLDCFWSARPLFRFTFILFLYIYHVFTVYVCMVGCVSFIHCESLNFYVLFSFPLRQTVVLVSGIFVPFCIFFFCFTIYFSLIYSVYVCMAGCVSFIHSEPLNVYVLFSFPLRQTVFLVSGVLVCLAASLSCLFLCPGTPQPPSHSLSPSPTSLFPQ